MKKKTPKRVRTQAQKDQRRAKRSPSVGFNVAPVTPPQETFEAAVNDHIHREIQEFKIRDQHAARSNRSAFALAEMVRALDGCGRSFLVIL